MYSLNCYQLQFMIILLPTALQATTRVTTTTTTARPFWEDPVQEQESKLDAISFCNGDAWDVDKPPTVWTEQIFCDRTNEIEKLRNQLKLVLAHLKKQPRDWDKDLFTAAYQQDEEAVQFLVEATGANANGCWNNWRNSPLILAAQGKNKVISTRLIKYLLEHQADAFHKDSNGDTFFHQLMSSGKRGTITPNQFHEMVVYLVSKNLTKLFTTSGGGGATPIMWAAKHLEVENGTLFLLKENNYNFSLVDGTGDSILEYSVDGMRSTGFLSLLIQLGADWRQPNNFHDNLIHTSAFAYNVEALKYFVGKGLDINAVNDWKFTPIQIVCMQRKKDVLETVRFMIKNGANVTIKNEMGNGPVDFVRLYHNINQTETEQLVQLLTES